MRGATLRDAELQDADLGEVPDLLERQLGGTNLYGAQMPDSLKEFKGLNYVEELSKKDEMLPPES